MPPLTCIVSPVIYDAASDAKNATELDISSPFPNLFIGILAIKVFFISSLILSVIAVWIKPGETQLIVIFFLAYSKARLFEKATMPAFEAE